MKRIVIALVLALSVVSVVGCGGGGAGRQPGPSRARERGLGGSLLVGGRRNGRMGHVPQYHDSASKPAPPSMKSL